jgi:hypothetical protein
MENVTLEVIHKDLKLVMRELSEIKKHMVDVDTILTPDEEEELEASIKNYKLGKTKDFDKVKKNLGL